MRALIVSLGSIGRRHFANLRQLLPDAEITVLRHEGGQPPPPNCRSLANHVVYSLEEALEARPDIAVIASPAPFHVAVADRLARHGIHLFMEKPISDRAEGVQGLIDLCRQRNVVLSVGYDLRFEPSLIAVHDAVHSGRIGRVMGFRAEVGQYLPDWRPTADYRQTVSARKELGGGVLLELSHEFDYARWIMGEVAEVFAQATRVSDLEIDVEDLAEVVLRFSNGTVGSVHLDMVQASPTRTCRIIGTEGTLTWDSQQRHARIFSRSTKQWSDLGPAAAGQRTSPFLDEMRQFLNCVAGNAAPSVSGEDGLRALEIALAAKESAECKRTIALGA